MVNFDCHSWQLWPKKKAAKSQNAFEPDKISVVKMEYCMELEIS